MLQCEGEVQNQIRKQREPANSWKGIVLVTDLAVIANHPCDAIKIIRIGSQDVAVIGVWKV